MPKLVRLDTVTPERVQWLWYPYIPLGKITLFDGDPGNGKSLFAIDLIARVMSGLPMPDGRAGIQGGAVTLSLEDGLSDTIVPKLEAAGGDKSKVVALQGVADANGVLRFPTIADVDHIAKACDAVQAKLLVVDPLMAYRDNNITEPIYTADETCKLKGISKEGLKRVHIVKKVFKVARVKDVQHKKDREVS